MNFAYNRCSMNFTAFLLSFFQFFRVTFQSRKISKYAFLKVQTVFKFLPESTLDVKHSIIFGQNPVADIKTQIIVKSICFSLCSGLKIKNCI